MANAKATTRPQGMRILRTYRAETTALVEKTAVMQGTDDDQAKNDTGAGVACLGIVEEGGGAAAAGDLVSVVQFGECIAIAGGVIAPGMSVKTDGNGKLIDASGTDAHVIGIARSTAAADTDEFVVFVKLDPKRSA